MVITPSATLTGYRVILLACLTTFCLFFACLPVNSQGTDGRNDWVDQPLLKNYTIENGLPTHWVRGAVEDHHGFIWFATAGGLTRFDGNTFRVYPCQLNDSLTIGADRVLDMVIDRDGEIWISRLYRPLERFNPKTERSYSYASRDNDLPNDHIYDLYFDPPYFIWVGHSMEGLISRINKKTGEIISFQVDTVITDNVNNKIWDLHRDQDGDLWAATNHGLYLFDSLSSGFKYCEFNHQQDQAPAYFDNVHDFKPGKLIMETTLGPTVLDKDSRQFHPLVGLPKSYRSGVNGYFIRNKNFLWIANPSSTGNNQGGIIRYDLYSDETVFYTLEPDIPLLRDRSGNIWLHDGKKGVSSFKPGQRKFKSYTYPFNHRITSLISDEAGHFWAGTEKGLLKLKIDNRGQLLVLEDHSLIIGSDKVTCLVRSSNNSIWVATTNGLFQYQPNKLLKEYPIKSFFDMRSEDGSRFEVTDIFEDQNGTLWLSGSVLVALNPETGSFKVHHSPDIQNLHHIRQDPFDNLWFANKDGVMLFNKNKSQFHTIDIPYSNSVTSIYLDSDKAWIGTNTGLYGMSLVDFDSLVLDKYHIECYNHLMPENYVVSIQGNQEHLWVLYPRGLAKINLGSNQAQVFGKHDGLTTGITEEKLITSFFDHDNDVYLCWPSGLTRFNQETIHQNDYLPPVVFTDFKIHNQSVNIGDSLNGKPILSRAIHDTNTLTLPSGTAFTLEFAALDYTDPGLNRYRYKVEGMDEDWSPPDFNRTVTYAKLSPGEYSFQVIASNNDGLWNNEGSSLNIIIYPPWWQTWWAYAIYALCALSAVLGLSYYEKKRFVLKQKAESLEEVDKAKNEFFANISHEFRTPLTLIMGPLKALREGTYKGDTATLMDMMSRNGDRLLRLVNQLLDLSKLDRGKMQLQYEYCNVTDLLRSVISSFDSTASLKKVDLRFVEAKSNVYNCIDKEKVRQVFFNLLSNAIKFTPEGGNVWLTLMGPEKLLDKDQRAVIKIIVTDSGIGIPKVEQSNIFNRFYQVSHSHQHKSDGTGIGLELTKKLIQLHGGNIEVESAPGQGSTFTVTLPVVQVDDQPDVLVNGQQEMAIDIEIEQDHDTTEHGEQTHSRYPVLLIVEDNSQMRHYIKSCLGGGFQYLEAANGEQGLELAGEKLPDLILCDVMMPGMDGFEFCKTIRNQHTTAHIPFIFLTARADHESLIEGLKIGSDDYVTKPFDDDELRLKVRNHLDKMQQYRSFFSKQMAMRGEIEQVEGLDHKFLDQAIKIVEDHLDNHEFTVQKFARLLGFSHTQLYRKLLALTGYSPTAFIRSIRLKKAAQLIVQNYGNTSDVAYAVGFNNLSYFTKCFKEQFGAVPSSYGKKLRME